ncbi:hypothetical protein C8R44DRAFT_988649 [Mycena epipterygia]|nr:hypothetical protein C8R44DRAFT_988649 [Mycena epipterygia]
MALRADLLCPHPRHASPSCSALLSLALRDTSLPSPCPPFLRLSLSLAHVHPLTNHLPYYRRSLITVDATSIAKLYSQRIGTVPSSLSAPLLYAARALLPAAPSFISSCPSPACFASDVAAACSIASFLTLSRRPPSSTPLPPILSCRSHPLHPTPRVVSHPSSKSCPFPHHPIASLPCTACRIPIPRPVSPHIITVPASSFLTAASFLPPGRCLLSSSAPLPPLPPHIASSALFRVPTSPAFQVNKIKNGVLKFTGAVQRNKIRITQLATAAAGTDTSSLGD